MNRLNPCRTKSRRGVATIYAITLVPVVGILLIAITDLANIQLARQELKTALEAASNSGVKTWFETGSTSQARTDAGNAFSSNTILGNTFTFDTTANGGGANGNGLSNEIFLGSITESNGLLTFDCEGTPVCITGTFTATFAVETDSDEGGGMGGNDTFNNPGSGVNPGGDRPSRVFRLESFTSSDPAIELQAIQIDLGSVNEGGTSAGYFDTRGVAASDVQGGIGDPDTANNPIGIDSQGANPSFTFLPPNVPNIPNGNNPQPQIMRVEFGNPISSIDNPGTPLVVETHRFFWGMDTDGVGANNGAGGGNGAVAQDFGAEFDGGTVTFTVAGQSFSAPLEAVEDLVDDNGNPVPAGDLTNRSEVTITRNITGNGRYGVYTRKTIQIPSLCPTFLGHSLGPYNITTRGIAQYRCDATEPELVVIETFVNCP